MTTTCDVLLQGFDVIVVGGEQRQRIGVVGGVLEEIFGRRVAGERAHTAPARENPPGTFAAGRLIRGWIRAACGIGGFGGLDVAAALLDAADPVQAVGIARIEGDGLLQNDASAASGSFELEVSLAKLMAGSGRPAAVRRPTPATAPCAMMYCLVAISA